MTIPNPETERNSSRFRLPAALRRNGLLTGGIAILLLTASASFGFGMLAERGMDQAGQVSVSTLPLSPGLPAGSSTNALPADAAHTLSASAASAAQAMPSGGEVVGSKASKEYFLPWCTGAAALTAAGGTASDTVWFSNESAAQSDGYVAGGNCPGI